jgi:hypothetical protein
MADRLCSGSIAERAGLVRQSAGVLVLVTGLALLTLVLFYLVQDASLWVLGRRTTAQVVGMWIEQDAKARTEAPAFRWFIRYQFRTRDDRVVAGVSRVSATEWAAMGHSGPVEVVYDAEGGSAEGEAGEIADGGHVAIVYFPAYPAHNRLDESRFAPILACAYVPLILFGCVGLVAGRSLLQKT